MSPPGSRPVRHLILGVVLVTALAPAFAGLKPAPQLVALLGLLLSLFVRRAAGPVLALAIVGAAITGATRALLLAFPAVTSDGHPVMPMSQVFFGAVLGLALGLVLARAYLGRWRAPRPERWVLGVLTAALVVTAVVDGLS